MVNIYNKEKIDNNSFARKLLHSNIVESLSIPCMESKPFVDTNDFITSTIL